MTENQGKINQLLEKLDSVFERQKLFSEEIVELREEIFSLKSDDAKKSVSTTKEKEITEIIQQSSPQVVQLKDEESISSEQNREKVLASPSYFDPKLNTQNEGSNLEKFIGENLINKIGIVITVIGVAIGAKYSIDHQLISPLTRIILGYFAGFILLGIGIRLKLKYENYSAVLVSGAMSIMYFITYFAFSFYHLMPQALVFVLMVIITVFTVFSALNYNRQVIAHIGLVGAYAVPFLLSDGSGNMKILYSYMAIINIGILVISFIRYWKPLYYTSFLLTWLIYF